MKVLNVGYTRYMYPRDVNSLEAFVALVNGREQSFMPLQQFDEERCVFPFLIVEDCKTVYVNCMNVSEIFEEEATLLNRAEYERRLEACVQETCVSCAHYQEDLDDNLHGHRAKLCLDGTCGWFDRKA